MSPAWQRKPRVKKPAGRPATPNRKVVLSVRVLPSIMAELQRRHERLAPRGKKFGLYVAEELERLLTTPHYCLTCCGAHERSE